MLSKLRAFVRQYDLIHPGDTVIAAVSGGADSIALLFALFLLREEWGIILEAAHFNHCLRGEESNRDARFVADFCAHYGIHLHMGSENVVPGEKGLEAAARDARYRFLRSLPGKVATAHTADDNAETVLMRLLRGTGLKGLGAIAPVSGNVIRPMLSVTRREVEAFLEEYALAHIEDSSNGEDAFLRNRIRHRIMPLLYEENPRIGENLSSMALNLRLDEACLSRLASGPMPGIEELKSLPDAIRRRYLERFLKENGVREPEESHLLQAESLLFHWNPSASMNFPGGIVIAREYDRLVRLDSPEMLGNYTLEKETYVEDLDLWVTVEDAISLEQGEHVFTVQPRGPLRLRARRSGDAIALSGGTRSLKKLFIDRKIPVSRRCRIPVVEDDDGILGVYGIGADRNRQASALPAKTIRFARRQKNGGIDHGE
ncbi:MAG: tRNA lysidine(34) synthetase TilS [Oscillospiraceae bacterium]|nr:tRNA lysidine(34) synthetase TilS [Oscillospiraceae bacterium]